MDGNVLGEKGLRYEAHYEYNGQNRMTYSETTSHVDMTHAISFYAYDALGRRTLTESITGQVLRTVYDGRSFEAIREGETFRDGSLTTQYANSAATRAAPLQSGQPTGERYRWIGEGYSGGNITEDGYNIERSRSGTRGVTLYGNGEAVAVSYSSSTSSRSVYLGKDILGSVRTATAEGGAVEDRYEYDAFGQAYKGDLSGGMNLGYTGKPYDAGTGLYNYGYRDYRPEAARFTTTDPVRDGNNWYAYVNNDPVNWIDPWGLNGVDGKKPSVVIDILGKIWALPMTIDGLIVGGVLTVIGKIAGNDVSVEIANNAITFNTGLDMGGAITLGNVIIYANVDNDTGEVWNKNSEVSRYDNPLVMVNLGQHEEAHTYQYQKYGPSTILVIIGSAIMNGGLSDIQNFMGYSSFERAADDYTQSSNQNGNSP
jgi:RHS repeat-associated protein